MLRSDPPIIIEQEINVPVSEIWSALTELEEMRQWFFDIIPDFKAEAGFETQFHLTNEGRDFPHLWKVVEVIPQEKIVVNWKFGGYSGSSNVAFEIIRTDDKNIIRLTTEVIEDHPQDIPEFRRESSVGGWNYFMKDRLYNYLTKKV